MIKLVKSLKYLAILTCFVAFYLLSGPLIVPKAEAQQPNGRFEVRVPNVNCPEGSLEMACLYSSPPDCWPLGGFICLF